MFLVILKLVKKLYHLHVLFNQFCYKILFEVVINFLEKYVGGGIFVNKLSRLISGKLILHMC